MQPHHAWTAQAVAWMPWHWQQARRAQASASVMRPRKPPGMACTIKMVSKGASKSQSSTAGLGRTLSHSKLLDGGRPAGKLAGQASDEAVSQLGLGCSALRLGHGCVLVLGGLLRTHAVRGWSANMLHPGERRQPPDPVTAVTAAPALLTGWRQSQHVQGLHAGGTACLLCRLGKSFCMVRPTHDLRLEPASSDGQPSADVVPGQHTAINPKYLHQRSLQQRDALA